MYAHTHNTHFGKPISYAKEKWARAKLLKEAFEARSDDVWKTYHKSLFKQRTSTEGWNKSENREMKALHLFRPFSVVYGFLIHGKDRKRHLEFMEYPKVKSVQPTYSSDEPNRHIFNDFFSMLNTITLSYSKIHNFKHNSLLVGKKFFEVRFY